MLGWLVDKITGGTVETVVTAAGRGISNILDRFFPRKLSEADKWEKVKDMMSFELEQGKLEIADVNKAREMYMAEVRNQPQPWIARLLNSVYRPLCGYIAIFYLTDKLWAQAVMALVPGFHWTAISRDSVVDGLIAAVIYFFFGYRQRSKEKGITGVG